MDATQTDNAEAIEAWDGVLFDRFVQYRHIVVGGLAPHGDEALRLHPPAPGDRALDIGCGFGDSAQQIAALIGPEGSVLGIDVSERFIEAAGQEAGEAGVANAQFAVADIETAQLGELDYAFSRFGMMFCANPVAAMRNVRSALVPGGRLVMVVWRRKIENEWMYRAQQIVEQFVAKPEDYDEPTCGPGPFSMADADTVSQQLGIAGYADISFRRCDIPILVGNDADEAVELVTALGPAGEILRLQGDRAAHLHEPVKAALREGLADYAREDGAIVAPASTWIVSAVA
jgi:ubiquinone/menaquinone biosynthesis C-methylase UbiE